MKPRQAQRYLLSLNVNYETSVHEHSWQTIHKNTKGKVLNVSTGGVCISTGEALRVGQVIRMALPLPHVEVTAPTLAEVRWVKTQEEKGTYHAGLRFLL